MKLLVGNKNLDVDFSKLVEPLISEYREISTEYENTVRFINQEYKDRLWKRQKKIWDLHI